MYQTPMKSHILRFTIVHLTGKWVNICTVCGVTHYQGFRVKLIRCFTMDTTPLYRLVRSKNDFS